MNSYKLPHDSLASIQDIVIPSLVSVKPKLVAAYTTEVETVLKRLMVSMLENDPDDPAIFL
jgi:hypothetical protein